MAKLPLALAALFLSTSALAQGYSEAHMIGEFCKADAKHAGILHHSLQKGEPADEREINQMVASNTGALLEKMVQTVKANIAADIDTTMRANFYMCVDNARQVMLDSRRGIRRSVEQLR